MHHHGHGGGWHHGGHIPISAFQNWGWGWNYPQYEIIEVQQPVPTWVWIAGGALSGMVLALLTRGR